MTQKVPHDGDDYVEISDLHLASKTDKSKSAVESEYEELPGDKLNSSVGVYEELQGVKGGVVDYSEVSVESKNELIPDYAVVGGEAFPDYAEVGFTEKVEEKEVLPSN